MIRLEEHFGEKIWTNTNTDSIRREECLCLQCEKMTSDKETNCPIAQAFYEQCIKHNVAFSMTRCKSFISKKDVKVFLNYDDGETTNELVVVYLQEEELPKQNSLFEYNKQKYKVASATYVSPDKRNYHAILTKN